MARIRAYFKFDLYFFENPKVVDLSHSATVLYIASIAYANRRETDGFIARPVLRRLIELPDYGDGPTHWNLAEELVKAGLWEEARPGDVQPDGPPRPPDGPGGWWIHDFLEHNDSTEDRAKRREADAARKREERTGKGGKDKESPGQKDYKASPENVQPDSSGRPDGRDTPSEPVRPIAVTEQSDSRAEEQTVVAFRPDIDQLCNLLADAIQVNTGERPKPGKRWHDACRLLLDSDGYSLEQVEALIRWSQQDEFWRSNILSMSKLREKRLTLIAQMQRPSRANRSRAEQQVDQARRTYEEMMANADQEGMGPHHGPLQPQLARPADHPRNR